MVSPSQTTEQPAMRGNSRPVAEIVPKVMEAISGLVPLVDGGHWSPNYTPKWPKDYTRAEIELRRAIATVAVLAVLEAQKP